MPCRSFWPLLEKAGLPKIRSHDLHHSTASLLLSMGVHPKIVQELPGHSTVSMTLDTCSHVLLPLQKEAVKCLDTLLANQEAAIAVRVAITPAKTARTTGDKKEKPASKAG